MKGRRPPGAEGKSTTAALHLIVKAEAKKEAEVEHLTCVNTLYTSFYFAG